jgi:putative spermidine/putrescine transport system permease protein
MTTITDPSLYKSVVRANKRRRAKAVSLVMPLLVFMAVGFFGPLIFVLVKSVENPEILVSFPRFSASLSAWTDRDAIPPESVVRAFVVDIVEAREERTLPLAGRRLNYEVAGGRQLLLSTGRRLSRLDEDVGSSTELLIDIDPLWADPAVWRTLARNASSLTAYYYLAATDLEYGPDGSVQYVGDERSLFLEVFTRTFVVSLVVTVLCFVIAYPMAYLLANLPGRIANLLMILVLLPFWTSVLVRTAGWIVVLQQKGVVNGFLLWLGVVDEPLELVFNRIGVYIAMTHILLPFMILPVYSVMRSISPSYMRAASSLGAPWARAFVSIYFPLTLPGVFAGAILVFITSLGYYVTPALVGGGGDQLISYFIAFYVNDTLNWGLAAALGALLLLSVLVIYGVFARFMGGGSLRLT